MKPPKAGQIGRYTNPEKGASNEKYKGWNVHGIE
jgi:hypothetical protein